MSGACNAGFDSNEIVGITRMDIPPRCIDVVQERLHAGYFKNTRQEGCFNKIYIYIVSLSTNCYKFMIKLKQ